MTESDLSICHPCGNKVFVAVVREEDENKYSELGDYPILTTLETTLDGKPKLLRALFSARFLQNFNPDQKQKIIDALLQTVEIVGDIRIGIESVTLEELDELHQLLKPIKEASQNLRIMV